MVVSFSRTLAALLALGMIVTTGGAAIASAAPTTEERIVDEWTAALLTRDPAVIEAMPWGHAAIAEAQRIVLAREVLANVVAEDAALADELRAPADFEGAAEILASLMFDRVGLVEELRREASAAYDGELARLPSDDVGIADTIVEAVSRDVEALAAVPAGLANAVLADAGGIEVGGPGSIVVSPPPAFELPVDIPFSVCWLSDAGQACTEVAPFLPTPLDVTGDAAPDLLATVSVLVEPTEILALVEGSVAPQVSFRVERITLDADLKVLVLGVFDVGDEALVVGYDAYTADAPEAGRQAPAVVTIVAHALSTEDETRAGMLFQPIGAGAALRTLAGVATSTDALWTPEEFLALDTSPVPATLDLGLRAWSDEDGGHFEGTIDLEGTTDLVATLQERSAESAESTVAQLAADDVGPAILLRVDRGVNDDGWQWQATAPLARVSFAEETTRFSDATFTTPTSWRRQAIELTDVPADIEVDVLELGSISLQSSTVLGSVQHVRQTYDFATHDETYQAVSAEDIPVSIELLANDLTGTYASDGTLGRVSFQTARLASSPAPGGIGGILFDLSDVLTNFVGLRTESAPEGHAFAVQLVSVPDAISFVLGETVRGVTLDLQMSRGLGEVHGIVQVDDRRGILYLSNIPKDIDLSASMDAGTVTVGYDASSGISQASVLFTDLSRTADPSVVHAYVQLLQLPRQVSLSVTRSGEAPRIDYSAVTSSADIRAFVSEELFDGDLTARLALWVDNLGAQTSLSLQKIGGRDTLKLVSQPPTELIFLEGFVSQAFSGSLSQHVGDDCCLDSFGYDVWYGYAMNARVTVENLRLRLTNVAALEMPLRVPDLTVTGTFSEFLVSWDTINLLGSSSAWLRVDLTVLWIDINVWNWGWSSGTSFDLDLRITRYADQWGTLASVRISPCDFRIDVHPRPVETMTNGFRILALQGQRQYLSLNPVNGAGQTAIPTWLMTGYMAWQYGGWSMDLDC